MKKKMLIFFGAPGVGKGTQAKIISSKLHIPHISTGDILREAISKKTELGLKAKETMDKGDLVSDELMADIIKVALKDKKAKDGFILDGFPRTLNQAKILQPIVKEISDEKLIIINLEADDDIIVSRLSQRRMCKTCSSIVNLNFLKDSNKCPTCGSENSFVKRVDDDEKVIRNRLKVFHETTEPVLEFYRNNNTTILLFDGTKSVSKLTKEILDKIN